MKNNNNVETKEILDKKGNIHDFTLNKVKSIYKKPIRKMMFVKNPHVIEADVNFIIENMYKDYDVNNGSFILFLKENFDKYYNLILDNKKEKDVDEINENMEIALSQNTKDEIKRRKIAFTNAKIKSSVRKENEHIEENPIQFDVLEGLEVDNKYNLKDLTSNIIFNKFPHLKVKVDDYLRLFETFYEILKDNNISTEEEAEKLFPLQLDGIIKGRLFSDEELIKKQINISENIKIIFNTLKQADIDFTIETDKDRFMMEFIIKLSHKGQEYDLSLLPTQYEKVIHIIGILPRGDIDIYADIEKFHDIIKPLKVISDYNNLFEKALKTLESFN